MLGGHGVDQHRFRCVTTWDFNVNQGQDLYFFHRMPRGGFWFPAVIEAPHDSDSDSDDDIESSSGDDTSSERSEDEGGEGSASVDIDESTPYYATDTSQVQTTQASEVEVDHDENDAFLMYVSDDEF